MSTRGAIWLDKSRAEEIIGIRADASRKGNHRRMPGSLEKQQRDFAAVVRFMEERLLGSLISHWHSTSRGGRFPILEKASEGCLCLPIRHQFVRGKPISHHGQVGGYRDQRAQARQGQNGNPLPALFQQQAAHGRGQHGECGHQPPQPDVLRFEKHMAQERVARDKEKQQQKIPASRKLVFQARFASASQKPDRPVDKRRQDDQRPD